MVFDVTPIAIHNDTNTLQCSLSCLYESKYLAFNMCARTLECQLLYVDRTTLLETMHFMQRSGWSYFDSGVACYNIRDEACRKIQMVGINSVKILIARYRILTFVNILHYHVNKTHVTYLEMSYI